MVGLGKIRIANLIFIISEYKVYKTISFIKHSISFLVFLHVRLSLFDIDKMKYKLYAIGDYPLC